MYFPERVLALTQNYLLPKVADNVFHSNIVGLRWIGRAKQGKGESIKKPIKYAISGYASSFAGLDTFVASQFVTKVRMSYDMRGIRIPLAIDGMEGVANQNSGDLQITDLVKETLDEGGSELSDALGGYLYSTGLGNSNKDPIGLGAIVDDGSNVTYIGYLSRTTYPVLKATRNAFTSGAVSFPQLATIYSAISDGSDMSTPTLGAANNTTWDYMEQLYTPSIRENYTQLGYYNVGLGPIERVPQQGLSGRGGFVAITYKGVPVVRDNKSPTGTIWFLNENWLDWYGWDPKGIFGYNAVKMGTSTTEGLYTDYPMSQWTGFGWSGFRAPFNQFAGIADVILLGNLMCWQPRRNGQGYGATGV